MPDEGGSVARLAALIDSALDARPGVSLNQIAFYAGVDTGYLSRIRRGLVKNPPSPRILRKLAPQLRVDYETLLEAAGYLLKPGEDEPEDQVLLNRARRELSDAEYAEILDYVRYRLQRAGGRTKADQSPS